MNIKKEISDIKCCIDSCSTCELFPHVSFDQFKNVFIIQCLFCGNKIEEIKSWKSIIQWNKLMRNKI